MVVGIGVFVAAGLFVFTAEKPNPVGAAAKPQPIDLAVVAPADQLSKAFAAVAAHVMPAVVSVYSEKTVTLTTPEFPFPFGDDFLRQFFGRGGPHSAHPRQQQGHELGTGSGMILDNRGHILTNYHVVRDVDDIKVQLSDQRKFEATVVGTDPQTDVAIIKIKGKVPSNLATVTLGNSDAMHVGDLVEAVGAPFGLLQTVTQGIISATGRSDVGIADYEDFLQTDAAINPGNSGGPLVNMRGEVIGMNSAIATSVGQSAGVGFSIPTSMIKAMLPRLIKGEKIIRGQLGVLIQNMTPGLAKQFHLSEPKGVLVSQVNKDTAAAKAGIKAGDVIVRFNGQDVADVRQLRNLVAGTTPGKKVPVVIIRDGKQLSITATVGTATAQTAMAAPSPAGANTLSKLGLTVETLTPQEARKLGIEFAQGGALITDVDESGPAALAGLQKGDVIVEADRQHVATVEQLERVLAKSKGQGQVLLRVSRHGGSLFVVITL